MSAYFARSDIEARYGVDEVKAWAIKNGEMDPTAIAARIASAIANAQDMIDASLRGGPLPVPLTLSPIPQTIVTCGVQLAAYDLYTSRGSQDFEDNGKALHRLSGERAEALETIAKIHSGRLQFSQDLPPAMYPGVVTIESRQDELEDDEATLSDFGL